MLRVRTKIAPSSIHGIGLFADEVIARGTVIWSFTPGFDRAFSRAEILRLPKEAQAYLAIYAYLSRTTGRYILPSDNGKYFNHASEPNTLSAHQNDTDEVKTHALRDIYPGEELTDNYTSFEDEQDPENILTELAAWDVG